MRVDLSLVVDDLEDILAEGFAGEDPDGGGSKSSSKADPNDFGAIESAVNEAAKRLNAVWVTFILLMAYIFIATGKITHKDLFLETPVKLPVLGVDVPLLGYFIAAPVFVLAMHFYFLIQLRGLAAKFGEYDVALSNLPNIDSVEEARLRHRIDNSLFAQVLAGPQGAADVILRFTAIATAISLSMLLLCLVQLAFLPYQDENLTNGHRLLIFGDSLLITLYFLRSQGNNGVSLRNRLSVRRWPRSTGEHPRWAARVGLSISAFRGEVEGAFVFLPVILVLIVPLFAVFVARIPSEHQLFPQLTASFFGADADPVHQGPSSWFSNRLVLPDQNLVEGFDLEKVKVTRSLRGRHFVGAIFDRADLRMADFTGANLNFASLQGAKLEKAQFGCAYSDSAGYSCTRLQEAHLDWAKMQEAELFGADMMGASLNRANLERASLSGAQVQGSSLQGAHLAGANLFSTALDGATLSGARLIATTLADASVRGVDFARTWMFGAVLDGALTHDSSFEHAQLQGASMARTNFSGSKFADARVFGADVSDARFNGTLIKNARVSREWEPLPPDRFYPGHFDIPQDPFGKEGDIVSNNSFSYDIEPDEPVEIPMSEDDRLRALFPKGLPPDPSGKEIKERIARLGPYTATPDWTKLVENPITEEQYIKNLGERLIIVACAKEGEGHVARGLMRSKRLCPYEEQLDEVFASGKMPDGRPCGDVENVKRAWSEMKGQFCPPKARQ